MSNKSKRLGDFELQVMLAVMRVGPGGYSVTIRSDIEERTGASVGNGALYVVLDRLRRKGMLDSWKGEPTPERGGRAKRHYRVTAAGKAAVEASRQALREMFEGIQANEHPQ